jgi:signal transduction histidine kinase
VNGGGLHQWEGGSLKPVAEPAAARSYPFVYSVLADRQGAIWAGLYGRTALRLADGVLTPFLLNENTSENMTPNALFEDHAGVVWLGCSHGLVRYERGQFTTYTVRDGLSCETVVALAEDRDGTLYLGTEGGGVNCLRQGRFTACQERHGLADNHVGGLLVDRENTLWVGTLNGGVSRLRNGRWATINSRDGLPSNTIGSILEDDESNLWLGSNRGLIRVRRPALNAYLDGDRRQPLDCQRFGTSDGLNTAGCTGGGQPRSWKARDGKLWFATVKGVAVVDPRQLPWNPLPPPVVIEAVVMDEQVHELHGTRVELRVPPQTHQLEFRFTGLSLAAPERVRFRYRLAPFDQDWVQAGTRRTAYYTGIPSGRYRFQVTACNNDGVWNQSGVELGLVVVPPWWQTRWFQLLAVTGVVGLVFGWNESRLQRLRRERQAQEHFSRRLIATQESERRRIAGELHDGLGQDLLVIANQAQLGLAHLADGPDTRTRLTEIAATARQVLQQARRMAHNLRPGLLEELGLTEAVQASVEKAAQAAGLSMQLDLANVDGLLPPEFEVSLFRIVQEALNNTLKHARASEVKVTLAHAPNTLRLVVADNGQGFDSDARAKSPLSQSGLGLRQIAERARMMHGRADLQSRPGQGTCLVVTVPLNPQEPA